MKPGDRVRNRIDGRRGTVEYRSTFGTKVTVEWDKGPRTLIPLTALQEEPCPKIDDCSVLRSFRDRDVPEAIYEDMVWEMCAKCKGVKV